MRRSSSAGHLIGSPTRLGPAAEKSDDAVYELSPSSGSPGLNSRSVTPPSARIATSNASESMPIMPIHNHPAPVTALVEISVAPPEMGASATSTTSTTATVDGVSCVDAVWRSSAWCGCFECRCKILVISLVAGVGLCLPVMLALIWLGNAFDALALGLTVEFLCYPLIVFVYGCQNRMHYVPGMSWITAAQYHLPKIIWPYGFVLGAAIFAIVLAESTNVFRTSVWMLLCYTLQFSVSSVYATVTFCRT